MFSFTLDIYCTSVRPGRGIPHMWLSLRFLLSFYLLKGFFSSFSLLLLRVKGRGCHTLLKPYETNCGLWIWAIQIKFDWLIDWLILSPSQIQTRPDQVTYEPRPVLSLLMKHTCYNCVIYIKCIIASLWWLSCVLGMVFVSYHSTSAPAAKANAVWYFLQAAKPMKTHSPLAISVLLWSILMS